jgi:DeoD family purine-nucleoside phosphorylase
VTIHLHPTAPLAERVLLPGDPGRALRLAQTLLDAPRMFNHNRGLWGYTGTAADGAPLTIQSTGMGGPSAAIVIAELATLGARRLVRVGTCGALDPSLRLGELVIATEAIAADGTSRALAGVDGAAGEQAQHGTSRRVAADPELIARLVDATGLGDATGAGSRVGAVVSTDLFYDGPDEQPWIDAGALAVEMETATLYALARRRGLRAATILIVTDVLFPTRIRIDTDVLHAAERRMGAVAVSALASAG